MFLYSVFDTVAESWSPPWLQENDRSADRSFQLLLKKNPDASSDLRLFCVGSWDSKNLRNPLSSGVELHEVSQSSIMRELENAQG